ncbi:MAG: 3'-5' exonuclease [Gemmatimonadaceae bacterium]|nr:3'-5' exonuclease [Gemmatimonadaceae bacterium]
MFGTSAAPRPTTLSARAAHRLAAGPLDAVTLMRDVCQVDRLQGEAAERMAQALLGSHPEFVRLPSGHWALAASEAAGSHGLLIKEAPESMAGSMPLPATVTRHRPPAAPSLDDITWAVVDVETTGTRAGSGDRITEIAIATVRGGDVVDVYSQLVNPERPIPPYITSLTHITWEMVRDQPVFRQIAEPVLERLQGAVFVAHNAGFDWRFVSEELRRATGRELHGPRLCTVRMARALVPMLSRRSLDHVTHYFGIEIEARHRAAGDAVATAHALRRMLTIAKDEGLSDWDALRRRVEGPKTVRRSTASDRRRRAFPLPASEDHSA